VGIASDALLGILSHSSLAIGLVVIRFFDDVRIDLLNYFFGDLLAVIRMIYYGFLPVDY
jgi:zinc transport system permease protein